nr:unnamed protein product [Callosobruchus chinensis]
MLNIKGKNDLSAHVKNAGDKLVVVDFYADWCKMVTPKFVDMENSFPEVVMANINLDENEELGKNDFSAHLKNAGDKLVVVDFYADWCKMVTPKFVDMENSFPEVVMANINLDENEELGQEYNIEWL